MVTMGRHANHTCRKTGREKYCSEKAIPQCRQGMKTTHIEEQRVTMTLRTGQAKNAGAESVSLKNVVLFFPKSTSTFKTGYIKVPNKLIEHKLM